MQRTVPARCRRYPVVARQEKGMKNKAARAGCPRRLGRYSDSKALNGFCCRRSGVSSNRLGKRAAAAGFLLGALVDFDGAFEIGAVFDHDARGGQVTDDRAILLDFDAVLGTKISLHVAID